MKKNRITLMITFISIMIILYSYAGISKTPKLVLNCREKINLLKYSNTSTPIVFSQEELNAYFEKNKARLFHDSVDCLRVTFKKNLIYIDAEANLTKAHLKSISKLERFFLWIFMGTHKIRALISLKAKNTKAIYKIKTMRFDNILIPSVIANSIANQVGMRQNPPLPPNKEFILPYKLKEIHIADHKLICIKIQGKTSS